jgi:hypothetical protein
MTADIEVALFVITWLIVKERPLNIIADYDF